MPQRSYAICIVTLIALICASSAVAQDTKEPTKAPVEVKKPSLIGLEQDGIHTTTYNSIMKCDVEIRSSFVTSGQPLRLTGVALAKGAQASLTTSAEGLAYKGLPVELLSFDANRKLWLLLKGQRTPVAAPQGLYQLSVSAKSREIISLHIGQAGTQLGKATCEPKATCDPAHVEAALGKQPN